ncbi:3-oxoacyl-reductase [Xylogone sp. PMI_703]|nr:3-oxoacyl-reductase [Xylogone sp. PMI_703]
MSVDNEISGRLALITGASGGIGAGVARDLYRQGVHVALTYSKSKQNIDNLVSDLRGSSAEGPKISVHQADMASADDITKMFEEIKQQHGHHPDILVANAGYGSRTPSILDISIEEFDYTISVNLRAAFILTKLAVPHMISQNWGRVIYMGSISGYGGGIAGCNYASSKAGLMGMAKNLAMKLGKHGITVNDVAPAMIGDTGMIPDAKFVENTPGDVRNIPVGRLGTPQEVANVVTMLCKTGYLTGQSILLSGGLK